MLVCYKQAVSQQQHSYDEAKASKEAACQPVSELLEEFHLGQKTLAGVHKGAEDKLDSLDM